MLCLHQLGHSAGGVLRYRDWQQKVLGIFINREHLTCVGNNIYTV